MYICCIWLLHDYSNTMTLYDSHSVYDYANECFDLCSGLFLLCYLWTVSRFVSTSQSTPSPYGMRRPTSWAGRTTRGDFPGWHGSPEWVQRPWHPERCGGLFTCRVALKAWTGSRQGWPLMSSVGASFHLEPWTPACQLQGPPSHY